MSWEASLFFYSLVFPLQHQSVHSQYTIYSFSLSRSSWQILFQMREIFPVFLESLLFLSWLKIKACLSPIHDELQKVCLFMIIKNPYPNIILIDNHICCNESQDNILFRCVQVMALTESHSPFSYKLSFLVADVHQPMLLLCQMNLDQLELVDMHNSNQI